MPTTSRFPWPQRTTAFAGVVLLVSAVLLLLDSSRAALPVTDAFVIPLFGPVVAFAAAVTRAVGFTVMAFGVAGEVGIAADSRLAKVALVGWGVRDLAYALLTVAPTWPGYLGFVLPVVFSAAAIASAVLVVRARVLSGFARWVLVPIAIVDCAFIVVFLVPLSAQLVSEATVGIPTELAAPVPAALIAIALLLWSRTEAVKHRAKSVYDAW